MKKGYISIVLFFRPSKMVLSVIIVLVYLTLEIQTPYGGLLSSSCEGQKTPKSKGDFSGRTNGRTDNGFKRVLREFSRKFLFANPTY